MINCRSILLLLPFVSAWIALSFFPVLPLIKEGSFSQAIFDDHHQLLRLTLSQDEQYRLFTPLSDIPPTLIEAMLLQEDQYFYWHPGINPFATVKAIWQTYVLETRRMGASTITMQLARMRYGISSKTWRGKLQQMVYALQLERHYSKKAILEAYLNLAPFGNNIEGVGSASLIYFGKPVQELTLPDILTLAVIPQNPSVRIANHKKLQESRNALFVRWQKQHPIDKKMASYMQLPLSLRHLQRMPFHAPHFVNEVLQTSSPYDAILETTLNFSLQKTIEKTTERYLARKKSLGITNAAVLLIDTRDLSIKALVGSADFFNQPISGQIDGTLTKRSPGSTLKPFIYGLALDQGLIYPLTMLKDVPSRFGSYNPENFDYDFMGPISAEDALVLSRNIPAIFLAQQLKKPNLYELLQTANVQHLKPESYYGLALTLGGAEMSMQELGGLYTALQNDGLWQPLRKLKKEPVSEGKSLLSPEASFLILDMLQKTPKYPFVPRDLKIAWKTGTSSGFRDAWSVGVWNGYVLVVWLGHFDNHRSPALIGQTMAAPLMFEIIQSLQAQLNKTPPLKQPNQLNITKIPVCKISGMLPTRFCPETQLSWFIPGKSPIKKDTIYREIPIDKISGLRVCQFDHNTRFEIYEFWPSDLQRIFLKAGIQRRSPPAYAKQCDSNFSVVNGFSPDITSPQTGSNYMVNPLITHKTIPFMATVDADVKTLYWFIDETFLGKSNADQAFLWNAIPGKFIVRVVDDHGRAEAMDLIVNTVF